MKSNDGRLGHYPQAAPLPTFWDNPLALRLTKPPSHHTSASFPRPKTLCQGSMKPRSTNVHLGFMDLFHETLREQHHQLQAFPGTLRGVAMQWFAGLPPKNIHTFNNLAKIFVSQIVGNYAKRLEVADLFDIWYTKDESLKKNP
ncbi:hypothetical protein CR513_23933, partial [Mucuna pruriens]